MSYGPNLPADAPIAGGDATAQERMGLLLHPLLDGGTLLLDIDRDENRGADDA